MSTLIQSDVEERSDLWHCREAVRQRLVGVRRSVRWHLACEGLAWTVAAIFGLAAVSLLFDRLVRPELSTRVVLVVAGIAVTLVVIWQRLVRPLRLKLDDLSLAELLDRRRPGVGQRLTNVLELPNLLRRGRVDGSPALIEAAVLEDAAALEQVDLHTLLNAARRRRLLGIVLATTGVVLVFYLLFPAVATLWAKRWLAGSNARWPQHTYLVISGLTDGRLFVPRGESAILQVDALPEFAKDADGWRVVGREGSLVVAADDQPHSETPDTVTLDYWPASGGHKQGTFTRFEEGRFRYELPPLTESATFTVSGGDDWTQTMQIEPVDRPSVKALTISALSPGKSEEERFEAGQRDAQLLFLRTTRLKFDLESDQPLASARIVSQTSAPPELARRDASHFATELEMQEPLSLEIQLVGQRGALASKPYFLTIGALNDRPPRVTIRSTGIGRRVTPQARLPLIVHAADDFGMTQLAVELEQLQLVESQPQTTMHRAHEESLQKEGATLPLDVESQPIIRLTDLSVAAGNTLRLRGRASDACVFGAQDGESRWLTLQVVTPEELFYEILTRQREQRGRFAKAVELAKTQLETIQRMTDLSEGAALARVHQVVARQVWQVGNQLDATLQEMTNNDLGSPQGRELLATAIIAPLRTLHAEGLADAGAKLQTMLAGGQLQEADRDSLAQAQQEVVTQMQRILTQMAQWESFVDVVNQLRHIIKQQDDLLNSTQKVEKERIKGIFND